MEARTSVFRSCGVACKLNCLHYMFLLLYFFMMNIETIHTQTHTPNRKYIGDMKMLLFLFLFVWSNNNLVLDYFGFDIWFIYTLGFGFKTFLICIQSGNVCWFYSFVCSFKRRNVTKLITRKENTMTRPYNYELTFNWRILLGCCLLFFACSELHYVNVSDNIRPTPKLPSIQTEICRLMKLFFCFIVACD